MPNGKPGDHPLTDILVHGESEYGEPVDGLVRRLAKQPNWAEMKQRVSDMLWKFSPMAASDADERKAHVESELRSLVQE